MRESVSLRARALVCVCVIVVAAALVAPPSAEAQSSTFKVAFFNIQSGKGEPALPGRPAILADSTNCTDPSQPLNGWGIGLVQQHLTQSIANDPKVIALGLAEAWSCGNPENVRQVLGWKSASGERNGVALLARHGFAGPEEWVQLDTSLNTNPADTMWVIRQAVCLDAACSASVDVFAAHWYGAGTYKNTSYDRQAAQTVEFLKRAGGDRPHMLIGDLNVFDGTVKVCAQNPNNIGLQRLREAAYVDAWPLLHGGAEGYTGMTNRAGCGTPEGYGWKRPDYTWSPSWFLPVSMARFAMTIPGEAAPSDHYGIITEFPLPYSPTAESAPVPAPSPAPEPEPAPAPGTIPEIVLYAQDATVVAGDWVRVADSSAAGSARLWNPNRGVAKLSAPAAAPADYIELTFDADAGRQYRLWLRGQAEGNAWQNDSVFVQFSSSVTSTGIPVYRIGSGEATVVSVEDCSGCGVSGWGWNDNGYNALGPVITFAASGTQTMRIQRREDGISIDQIVLSAEAFLTTAPGATHNDATILPKPELAADEPAPTPEPDPAPAAEPVPTTEPSPTTTEPEPVAPAVPAIPEIVLHADDASTVAGMWQMIEDPTAAGGRRVWNADNGAPKLSTPFAAPADYVDIPFEAEAGRRYRLWIRARADNDAWQNDSVFVQFSGSIDAAGAPVFRIGTASATMVSLEDCGGCGVSGWGWNDNGYNALGPLVGFEQSGPQTIRIQRREDGISIDQIILSAERYVTASPGAAKQDDTIVARILGALVEDDPESAVPTPVETSATEPAPAAVEIIIGAGTPTTLAGGWRLVQDPTAADGIAVTHDDTGSAKIQQALAEPPTGYAEFTFHAEAGRPYRLWLRGRAEGDYWGNDSVFVQFSRATAMDGTAAARIGTTTALSVNLEEASGAGLSGWGWQDNGWGTGVLGPLVMFEATGPQTIRIQNREDGLRIDQIVLSAEKYLTSSPGAPKNDATVLR